VQDGNEQIHKALAGCVSGLSLKRHSWLQRRKQVPIIDAALCFCGTTDYANSWQKDKKDELKKLQCTMFALLQN
jgi:hypothetical protein